MGLLAIVSPMPFASVTSSRGTAPEHLSSPDPKEVWADNATGTAATLFVDLGSIQRVDTILLGYVQPIADGTKWSISGGQDSAGSYVLQAEAPLHVSDDRGSSVRVHALWTGATTSVRYLEINLTQPPEADPISVGCLVVGQAFVARYGPEWGGGRRPIDLGVATSLPSGGFSVVEGARKRAVDWTFGDLTEVETDQLERIGLSLGATKPALVIETSSAIPGSPARVHYGLFEKWRSFERRNRAQTRWELGIEEWV